MNCNLPPHRGADFIQYILRRARVAASFWTPPNADDFAKMRADGLEIAEVRLDLAKMQTENFAREILAAVCALPSVLTIRWRKEGGKFGGDENARRELFYRLSPFASVVDIELAADIRADVVAAAKESGAAVIVSRHNFSAVDSPQKMNADAECAFGEGADIFKIAMAVKDENDFAILESFLQKWNAHRVVVIGMGDSEFARRTRLQFPAQGSRIAFAAKFAAPIEAGIPTEASAPGQLSIAQTAAAISSFRRKPKSIPGD